MCVSDIISEISLTLKDTYIWTKYQKIVVGTMIFRFGVVLNIFLKH